jgi:hypothetical protein
VDGLVPHQDLDGLFGAFLTANGERLLRNGDLGIATGGFDPHSVVRRVAGGYSGLGTLSCGGQGDGGVHTDSWHGAPGVVRSYRSPGSGEALERMHCLAS